MKTFEQQIHLQYLWQSLLGNTPTDRKRNVRLVVGPMPYSLDEIEGHFSNLPYRNAHRLENRDPDSISGAWGISFWRSERMYGNVPLKYIKDVLPFADVTPELWKNARAFRKLCYYRVTTAKQAIHLLKAGREVRYACEVNSDWYDPKDGIIPAVSDNPEFIASHAVPIARFDPETRRFVFPNS